MRTLVTFKSSAFNTTDSKDYFINPLCFGDDVAKWLISELQAKGIETDKEPRQEDFGWHFDFTLPKGRHCLVIGFQPEDNNGQGNWICWLERSHGLIGLIFKGREHGISPKSVETIHQILSSSQDKIKNVRWHIPNDFDKKNETSDSPNP
jgi:hypothetical protein